MCLSHVSHSFIVDGVYRTGFAVTQEAYDGGVRDVFNALDKAETMLKDKEYLVGDRLTEADIRLWVTIVSALLLGLVSLSDIPFIR
jgi:glutathionyl-hydroquinone reductase